MFGNMGLHIIDCPTGKWTYVGNVPGDLVNWGEASYKDIMAGRAKRDGSGKIVSWKVMVFDTKKDAVQFAASKGYEVRS